MKFASIISLIFATTVSADCTHSELRIAPGSFQSLDSELRDFIESTSEKDKELNKHIKIVEKEGQGTPMLVFVDDAGKDMETVLVGHIPISMTKDLIKEKKCTGQQ